MWDYSCYFSSEYINKSDLRHLERMACFILLYWKGCLKIKWEKIILVIVKAWKVNRHKGIHRNKYSKIKINLFIQSDCISGIPETEYSISFKSVIKRFLHWFQESRYRRLYEKSCGNTLTPEIRAENIPLILIHELTAFFLTASNCISGLTLQVSTKLVGDFLSGITRVSSVPASCLQLYLWQFNRAGCQWPATKREEIVERFKRCQKQSAWVKRNLRVGFLLLAEIGKDF